MKKTARRYFIGAPPVQCLAEMMGDQDADCARRAGIISRNT
jgi:hypothetical protein